MITTQELSQSDLFAGLSDEQLAALVILGDEITCAKGKTLFEEGDQATKLYILIEGKISIQVHLTSRPEKIGTTILNQFGQIVGWSGFVPPNHYSASGYCLEDSRLLAINGVAFMRALEQDAEMGFLIMRRVAEVISWRLRNIQHVVLKTM